MSARDCYMSIHPERRKKKVTCRVCHNTAQVKKDGALAKHFMPGMSLGYGMPTWRGPVCAQSGKVNPPSEKSC